MQITYKKAYQKSFSKLDPSLKKKAIEKIEIFIKNPFSQILNNHALKGKYEGYRSINITGDYRAIFCEYPDGTYDFVDFVEIGTHSQLY